jgi:hypothetical protein
MTTVNLGEFGDQQRRSWSHHTNQRSIENAWDVILHSWISEFPLSNIQERVSTSNAGNLE